MQSKSYLLQHAQNYEARTILEMLFQLFYQHFYPSLWFQAALSYLPCCCKGRISHPPTYWASWGLLCPNSQCYPFVYPSTGALSICSDITICNAWKELRKEVLLGAACSGCLVVTLFWIGVNSAVKFSFLYCTWLSLGTSSWDFLLWTLLYSFLTSPSYL